MTVIPITHPKEIPHKYFHCYVAEPSPENAIQQYKEQYGKEAPQVYFKRMPSGRCAVYIPVEVDEFGHPVR